MKKLVLFAVIIFFGLLQATVLNYIDIFNVKPDLLLISVVIASLFCASGWALFLSVFAGILKDILSVNAFGFNSLLFFSWSFLIIKLSRNITFDSDYIRLALIFVIAIFNNIITRLISFFLGNSISWGISLRIIIIGPLYTAFIFPLALKLAKQLGFSEEQTG